MIDNEQKRLLVEMGKTNYGRILREYLEDAKKEIGDITKVETWEETIGKKYALNLINDLFNVMEEIKKEPVNKNKYI